MIAHLLLWGNAYCQIIRRTHDNQYQAVADEDENGVRPDRVLLTVA